MRTHHLDKISLSDDLIQDISGIRDVWLPESVASARLDGSLVKFGASRLTESD